MATMDARGGPLQQPYPSMPASPTLTNPDMILPDYDLGSHPNLDDEDHAAHRSQSPLMMWQNAHAATSGTDFQQLFHGVPDHHTYPTTSMAPSTPIIYGNGTMLSDIGEVTEAESTPGRPSTRSTHRRGVNSIGSIDSTDVTFGAAGARSRSASPTPPPHNLRHTFQHGHYQNANSSRDSLVETTRRSSPTMGVEEANGSSGGGASGGGGGKVSIKQRARQQQQNQQQAAHGRTRRDSIDSNSTITTQDQALFADFDDSVSVGDSVFQGDDEESVAESYTYVGEAYVARQVPIMSTTASSALLAIPDLQSAGSVSGGNTSDDGERRFSTVSLSLRAEKILANAKKRLTTMEGNLSRARSSLYITSPTAGSFPSDGSTPSPRTPPARSATAGSRYHDPLPTSPLQSRIVSDGSTHINGVNQNKQLQRSASALGAAGGYRQPRRTDDAGTESSILRTSYSSNAVENTLGRVNEVEAPDDTSASAFRRTTQLETFLSPDTRTYTNDKGLARSASVAQMRDLKDQMKDLKGKISTLREQARADNLKRRSLQSLQTPSPFTNAHVDQWYSEPRKSQETRSATESVEQDTAWNEKLSSVIGDQAGAGKAELLGVRRTFVTPPPRKLAEPAEFPEPAPPSTNAPVFGSAGHSSDSRSPWRHDHDEVETDEASIISAYEDGRENGTVQQEKFSQGSRGSRILDDDPSSGLSGTVASIELAGHGTHEMYDMDDLDDLQTQNGDASDDDEAAFAAADAYVDDDGLHHSQLYGAPAGDDDVTGKEPNTLPLVSQQVDEDGGGYESEGGESLYHDSVQHQLSHEDRDDAFDYEHFILHSALGTISQQRLVGRERSDSFSSEDSVETTRGPDTSNGDGAPLSSPTRRASMSSIVTTDSVDSFATATEGRISRSNHSSPDADDILPDTSGHTRQHRVDSLLLEESFDKTATRSVSTDSFRAAAAPLAKRNSAEEPRRMQQPMVARRPASSAATAGHRPSVSSLESFGTMRSFPLVNRNRLGSASTGNMAGPGGPIGPGSGTGTPLPSSTQAPSFGGRLPSDDKELREDSGMPTSETARVVKSRQAADASEAESQSSANTHQSRQSMDSQRSQFSVVDGTREHSGSRPSTLPSNSMTISHAEALQELSREDQFLVERLLGNLGRCVLGLSESGRASAESRAFRRRIDAARRILEGLETV